ncbi:MAG: hypothetical protein WC623_13780 [Pedobacter sp.]|uniref:hypothetical protein n=1 Tax=Pedobacter sp. TaxID=1411316 RepID=UPI00356355D6
MNKLKKTALGAIVAGLAFGLSAFSTLKTSTVFTYYKTDLSYPAADYRGYVYYSGDRCESGGEVCSAQWDIGLNIPPTNGALLPATGVTFQTGTVIDGHFD